MSKADTRDRSQGASVSFGRTQPKSPKREERNRRLGIDCADKLVWKHWTPGGEYVKALEIRNTLHQSQVIKYALPENKVCPPHPPVFPAERVGRADGPFGLWSPQNFLCCRWSLLVAAVAAVAAVLVVLRAMTVSARRWSGLTVSLGLACRWGRWCFWWRRCWAPLGPLEALVLWLGWRPGARP